MSAQGLQDIVYRVTRRHIEASHSDRLDELDAVFDTAFEIAVDQTPRVESSDPAQGLPFEASLLELSVVGFTVVSAVYFVQRVQLSRLSRDVEALRALVDEARGFTKVQQGELRRIVDLAIEEASTWEPGQRAEPLAVEALQLLVLRRERHGRPLLEFLLHGETGGAGGSYDLRSYGEVALAREPKELVTHFYARMVKGDLASEHERASATRWVRQRGAYLAETFLPESLRVELSDRARTGGPLLVVSEEPWIPWEALRVSAGGGTGDGTFLAEAFALARWLPGGRPAAELPLRRIALVRSEKADAVQRGGGEASALIRLAEGAGRAAETVAASSLELLDAMARGAHDGWHFIGHGGHARAGVEWDELALDDGVLNPQDLTGDVAAGLAEARPFVFLNACHVGGVGEGVDGIGGWPARLLEVGAGAFLGSLWAIPSDRAAVFAPAVYDRLLAGEPIGEAVRQARFALRQRFPGDPTWLAYSLYADPGASSPSMGR